jgi:CDGSH iron-sulfur domain-containing protein 3
MADEGFIADRNPYLVQVEAGKTYFWCACGRSHNQPFCDGSHAGTDKSPRRFTAERTEEVALCGCKQTLDPPFCDGSHNAL